jgi:hypothetical protein
MRADSGGAARGVGTKPGRVASGACANSVEVGGGARDIRVGGYHCSGDLRLASGTASNVCDTLVERARLDPWQVLESQ